MFTLRAAILLNLVLASVAQAQVTIEIDRYTITAPTEKTARAKARELAWSASLFEDLLSTPAPQGLVILRGDPNAGGLPPMRQCEGWTLPWFAEAGAPHAAEGGSWEAHPFSPLLHHGSPDWRKGHGRPA